MHAQVHERTWTAYLDTPVVTCRAQTQVEQAKLARSNLHDRNENMT